MTSAFSWQNSISVCPASFCTPRPNLPVTPGVSRLPTFAFQSPLMKTERISKLTLGDYIQEVSNRIQPRIQDFGSSSCVSSCKTVSFHSYRTVYPKGTQ